MQITSPAFTEGTKIPDKYTKYGDNIIPPLHFENVPDDAASLALIMDDPDAPKGTFTHWLLFNMEPDVDEVEEGSVPTPSKQGKNDYDESAYGGPKPPSGEHRYFFKLFALDMMLPLNTGVSREELEDALEDHILAEATLMGRYAHGTAESQLSKTQPAK